ncbi:B12-binding domain-containing radical SAM protein [Candidatus Bathyarchaeota archaeon]|nr:B12-binding domain-containing radical SAM protein [Candidatus Bathyarchaeota archaeon]
MIRVTLVYPFFKPFYDNSLFRFPPLGLGYIAASLKSQGVQVELVDCTFLSREQAVSRVKQSKPNILGFYSMFSMKKTTMELAALLRNDCELLVVGGPLPTLDPAGYLDIFDVVILGEGEVAMTEIAECHEKCVGFSDVDGVAFKDNGLVTQTSPRKQVEDLDSLPFPAREFFDNEAYKQHYLRRFGYSISPLITSRGCPFSCDFCSRPVFGKSFRSRSAGNVVDEVEEIAGFGYDRIWFADDCFTLNPERLLGVCDELVKRRVNMSWECLSRVDTMDHEVAVKMRRAGCLRVFFGIESGNNEVLDLMRKQITVEQARKAVFNAKAAGLQVGAFFILGYPGENDETVLDTVRFASGLPLDYLSFTLPYPIPGTALFERVKVNDGFVVEDWEEPKNMALIRHKLLYSSGFSEAKLKFAIGKAHIQFYGRRFLGKRGFHIVGSPFERATDVAFKLMR